MLSFPHCVLRSIAVARPSGGGRDPGQRGPGEAHLHEEAGRHERAVRYRDQSVASTADGYMSIYECSPLRLFYTKLCIVMASKDLTLLFQ